MYLHHHIIENSTDRDKARSKLIKYLIRKKINNDDIIRTMIILLPLEKFENCLKTKAHAIGINNMPYECKQLLSLGLNFTRSPKPLSFEELHNAQFALYRRIALKFMFRYNDDGPIPPMYVSNKTYMPHDKDLLMIHPIKSFLDEWFNTTKPNNKMFTNVSRKHQAALNIINNRLNQDWLLVNTDKNMGLAIINKELYNELMMEHINQPDTYIPLDKLEDIEMRINWIKKWCNARLNNLDRFLGKKNPSHALRYIEEKMDKGKMNPTMYGLLKIHKNIERPPIRPIIPMCKNKLSGVHKFLALMLKHITYKIKYILLSTVEVIKTLMNIQLPPTAVMIIADIKSMYTNIDLREASIVASTALASSPSVKILLKQVSEREWGQLIYTLVNASCFTHQGKMYKPIHGLCMGSESSPILANLTVHYREVQSQIFNNKNLLHYFRFYDDVLAIFNGLSIDECKILMTNCIKPFKLTDEFTGSDRLEFDWNTAEIVQAKELNTKTINFLDIDISGSLDEINNRVKIHTNMHYKKLSAYQYVPWKSGHPTATKIGIIRTELTRRRILCSNMKDYHTAAIHLIKCLRERGYPIDICYKTYISIEYNKRQEAIDKIFKKLEMTRQKAKVPWIKEKSLSIWYPTVIRHTLIPIVIRYDPRWHQQLKELKRKLTELMGKLIPSTRVLIAYVNNPKLLKPYKFNNQINEICDVNSTLNPKTTREK
ncbi:MAG: hypothetical protein ACRC28_17530 [Clostridium sp.]|uniref:hypothetical protein n=1 Tax=Clostridium sp. TaxID=1506 RepID=UPI003F3B8C3C